MTNKKKILVYTIQSGGINKFRVQDPHTQLLELYNNDFDINFRMHTTIGENNDHEYDLVFIHSSIATNEKLFTKIKTIQKSTKTVIDVDDYWEFPYTHPLFQYNKKANIKKNLMDVLKDAVLVTTTTDSLRQKIVSTNKNVIVLENCINPTERQFKKSPNNDTDTLRIGYLGGSTHLHDLDELDGLFTYAQKLEKPTQFVLCGFDDRSIDTSTGKMEFKGENSTWHQMEKKFTDNYNFSKNLLLFKTKLHNFAKELDDKEVDNPYRRVWTKNINTYGMSYDTFDVSLIPLKDNIFNGCKSELKLLEAAYKGKVVIVSNVNPYRKIIEHGVNGLISYKDKDWKKNVKFLIDNPDQIDILASNLTKTISEKFDYKKITEKRKKIYLQV